MLMPKPDFFSIGLGGWRGRKAVLPTRSQSSHGSENIDRVHSGPELEIQIVGSLAKDDSRSPGIVDHCVHPRHSRAEQRCCAPGGEVPMCRPRSSETYCRRRDVPAERIAMRQMRDVLW